MPSARHVRPATSGPATLEARRASTRPTAHGRADYALVVDGVLLGIVEAKRLTLGPQNVLVQAERYSRAAARIPVRAGGPAPGGRVAPSFAPLPVPPFGNTSFTKVAERLQMMPAIRARSRSSTPSIGCVATR